MLASLPEAQVTEVLNGLTEKQCIELKYDWRFWARPKQLAPEGDWGTWVIRAGRGFGKTRSGSGWMQEEAYSHPGWFALIAKNPADARDYMIEGPGGLLRNARPDQKPVYIASNRRVTWPNGAYATIYSDEEPEQLRGFSGLRAWLDEFGKYRYPKETWDNLQFGMREASADRPRQLITTTPRPLAILKQIERMPGTITVVGSSYENRSNLDPNWFEQTIQAYEGSRFGRQEIHAEILEDVPGALWVRRNLDENRRSKAPDLVRIVVGVDPAVTSSEGSNETGIIVVGIGNDGRGYVLDDWSMRGSPDEWARMAVAAYRRYEADKIVAEVNQGGDMVEATLRSVEPSVPVLKVRASRGKYIRAEPISALYEQGRISHVGTFDKLEDQMTSFTPETAADRKDGYSPDRVDALVWAATELFPQITRRVDASDDGSPIGAYGGDFS